MQTIDLTVDSSQRILRPQGVEPPVEAVVSIIAAVRSRGDEALYELTEQFDGATLTDLRVSAEEFEEAQAQLPDALREALTVSMRRIRKFADHQSLLAWEDDIEGAALGEVVTAVTRAGVYVPGGRAAYPSSVLMGVVPAQVAGVKEIVICVPCAVDGRVPAATLAAAALAGVDEIYKVGGAQAIAALAYGTATIPAVDVVVGPGNRYVAEAKRQVAGSVAIDSVAGPSEIVIVADGSADPRVLAWDLIAQAEHGPGGAFALVTWDGGLIPSVSAALERILEEVRASDGLREALSGGLTGALVAGLEQAADVVNEFAPEHLELVFESADTNVDKFTEAGAIFVGPFSPVSVGDYIAGSNHVLPTGGTARWASGLRTSHFQKAVAVVKCDRETLRESAAALEILSHAEGLPLHSEAVRARLETQDRSR